MNIPMTFKRYELKYLLSRPEKNAVLKAMEPYMTLDDYGRTTIRNLYYDTDSFLLARRSMEHPVYKEKLRVRSYENVSMEDRVFVELKKKYDSIVYKRRLTMPYEEALMWLAGDEKREESQIAREITWFRDFYETLKPVVFLSYEREAYYNLAGEDFRITFDENILARTRRLSLAGDVTGTPLIPRNMTLMEIKCSGGYPLWLTKVLSSRHIYKGSFSKYGTAYENLILEQMAEIHAVS